MKYTVGTYIVGKGSGDIKTGEKISINKISKTPSKYGTISVFFWKDEYSDKFDPSELDGLQLKKINNSPEYGGGIDETTMKLKTLLNEQQGKSGHAKEILSLLADRKLRSHWSMLGDDIGYANFKKIDELYDALYNELKKYE